MNRYLIYALLLFFIGQSCIWLQSNGQFVSDWIKKNPILISIFGAPIAYVFIKATQYSHMYFNNLWGGRMLGFSIGIFTFTAMTWFFVGEPITTKTLLTLLLAFGIICIQVFG
jgi:hypothetical protein